MPWVLWGPGNLKKKRLGIEKNNSVRAWNWPQRGLWDGAENSPTSLHHLHWNHKSPLQHIFRLLSDHWAHGVFLDFLPLGTCKLIPRWGSSGDLGSSEWCRQPSSHIFCPMEPACPGVLAATSGGGGEAARWTGISLSGGLQHLWGLEPLSDGQQDAGMWLWFCGACCKAPRPLMPPGCQQISRLSERLNSAKRHLKLNSRGGGKTDGRQGREERARGRKRELSFSLCLF